MDRGIVIGDEQILKDRLITKGWGTAKTPG
jgi:hypothetical protein